MEEREFFVLSILHWIVVHAGLSSPSSRWYLFWSGIGADWTRLLAIGTVLRLSKQLAQHHKDQTGQLERHHRDRMGKDSK